MIKSLIGLVQEVGDGYLVVLVGGVGLRVWVPHPVIEKAPGIGRSVALHTHLHWRENDIALYGFSSDDELRLFELLLGVSGVGPRLALAILSRISPDLLTSAVAREEPEILERVPGIGRKTAQRIMFHLRDKLKFDHIAIGAEAMTDMDAEVIAALTGLGYSVVEAQAVVQKLPRDTPQELEDRVRLALSSLGS